MASAYIVKRSANVAPPTTTELATSELAYSQDQANDGDGAILYIESIDSDNNPVIHKVGGKYYTDLLDLATHFANANTIVRRDNTGSIKVNKVTGDLYGTANVSLVANFATLAHKSNSAIVSDTSNKWTTPRSITLSGDATGSVFIDGSSNVTLEVTVVNGGSSDGGNASVSAYAIREERANSTTIANLANIAVNATNANVSLFAANSGNANIAAYAINSGNADVAIFAQQAASATLATLATTATNATSATSAGTATLAGHANTSNTASSAAIATLANSSVIANNANNAINATVAVYSTSAERANSAVISNTANNSINANISVFATLSEKSNSSVIANNANNAINATVAVYSTSASISDTANKWTTPRTITILGDAIGSVSIDGSANANLSLDIGYAETSNVANIASRSTYAENATNANVSAYATLAEKSNSSVISNTANTLTRPITINVIGDAEGSVTFDGSANANLSIAITTTTESVSIADTANALTTPFLLELDGNASGNVSIDGSANVLLSVDVNYATTAATADYATLAETSNSTVIANNANNAINATTAVSATIANTANNAINATVSVSATIANSANNAINAQVSTFATLANSANIATSANNAINATTAVTATTASFADNAGNANVSINSTNSTNANVALFSANAGNANVSTYATLSERSNSAVIANSANNAINATVSVYATLAETSNSAVIANDANNAINATISQNAVFAFLAETANSTVSADSAAFAESANHASTSDYAVNATNANISVYATLAETSNSAVIANTANTLTTARTISIGGAVNGSGSFNGSANVNIVTTIDFANVSVKLADNTTGDYVNNVIAGNGITITGQGGECANITVTMGLTAVTPGVYGGANQIPTFNVDARGRLINAGNVAISTDVLIGGNSGSDTVSTGEVLRIVGTNNLSTSVSGNTVTITDSGITRVDGTANQIQASANVGNITLSLPTNLVAPGNVTIQGQLNVLGNISTTNFVTVTAEDTMIKLANNNSVSDAVDIGFYGQYNSGGLKFAGLVRDASDGVFKLFKDISTEPDNVINFTNVAIATIRANLTGGNVSSLFQPITVADGGTGNSTFKANSVIVGNGANKLESITVTEGQTMKVVNGLPAFTTVTEVPATVEFYVGTANTIISNARVLEAGNNITIDKTIAGKAIIKREALTGDVSSPANSNTLTIASNVVTLAKMMAAPAKSILINPLTTTNTLSYLQLSGTGKILGTDASGGINVLTLSTGITLTGNTITVDAVGGGAPGNTIISGTVDPTAGIGSNNDSYINKANATFFGPKTANTWPAGINLKGKPGLDYNWTTAVTNSDPGTNKAKLNAINDASISMIRINITDANGVNRANHLAAIGPNGTIDVAPLSSSGTSLLRLLTTGNATLVGSTYYNVPCRFLSGTKPGDGEPVAIFYQPGPNLYWDDVAQVLKNANGVEISNPLTFDTPNEVPVAANMINKAGVVKNNGMPYGVYSEGNVINVLGGERLHAYQATSVRKIITPSSGLTWTVSNNAGKARITTVGAVAHNLTTANAVYSGNTAKAELKVVSGTNWTANTFHDITAIPSTTQVDLNTTFVTGMGAPVIVGLNTEIEVFRVTLPKLYANSVVAVKFGFLNSSNFSKRIRAYLGTSMIADVTHGSTNKYLPVELGFANQGQTNLQFGLHGSNSFGLDGGTILPIETNVETANGSVDFVITFMPTTADVVMEMSNFFVYIRGG